MTRRHDIDALRAIVFAFLILYHCGMLYVGGDDWGWHIKSSHLADWLQVPMLAMNRWRMDLVFLISGLSVSFLLRDTQIGRFIASRSLRLLLPLTFGILVVVPIQPYVEGVTNGVVEPGLGAFLIKYFSGQQWPEHAFAGWQHGYTWNHLWYLAYLWVYTLVLAALLPLLRSGIGTRVQKWFNGLRGARLLLLPALPLFAGTVLLQPHFPATGDLVHDWFRHAQYFCVFLFGYWIGVDAGIWQELSRLRRHSLSIAMALLAVYLSLVYLAPDDVPYSVLLFAWAVRNAYLWIVLCAILGWAHAYLNRPWRWLPWANEAVYPWYVLHQSLTVGIAYVLVPLPLGPVLEPVLVVGGTVAGCALIHQWLVRPNRWLRPLFGLKNSPAVQRVANSAEPA